MIPSRRFLTAAIASVALLITLPGPAVAKSAFQLVSSVNASDHSVDGLVAVNFRTFSPWHSAVQGLITRTTSAFADKGAHEPALLDRSWTGAYLLDLVELDAGHFAIDEDASHVAAEIKPMFAAKRLFKSDSKPIQKEENHDQSPLHQGFAARRRIQIRCCGRCLA